MSNWYEAPDGSMINLSKMSSFWKFSDGLIRFSTTLMSDDFLDIYFEFKEDRDEEFERLKELVRK